MERKTGTYQVATVAGEDVRALVPHPLPPRDPPLLLDGNGRIGRLLIVILLEHWHVIDAPLLYLSAGFKRHRRDQCGLEKTAGVITVITS